MPISIKPKYRSPAVRRDCGAMAPSSAALLQWVLPSVLSASASTVVDSTGKAALHHYRGDISACEILSRHSRAPPPRASSASNRFARPRPPRV
jgi:hypothetical protein